MSLTDRAGRAPVKQHYFTSHFNVHNRITHRTCTISPLCTAFSATSSTETLRYHLRHTHPTVFEKLLVIEAAAGVLYKSDNKMREAKKRKEAPAEEPSPFIDLTAASSVAASSSQPSAALLPVTPFPPTAKQFRLNSDLTISTKDLSMCSIISTGRLVQLLTIWALKILIPQGA